MAGLLSGPELRALCEEPRSQLSLRRLRWDDFWSAVSARPQAPPMTTLRSTAETIAGGHADAVVRVRIGQQKFRRQLIEKLGAVCAFTGPAPIAALEAAHLYSYATVGEHYVYGGFLLRRDIHRLFDIGLLAVHPDSLTVDVATSLTSYEEYRRLQGVALSIETTTAHRVWLRAHWTMHRSTS